MKHEEKKWKVRTEVGAAFGDSEGNFAGKTLSRGTFVVDGEFGTLEGARKLISAAPELLKLAKMERDKHLFGEAEFSLKYGVNWNDIKGIRNELIAKAEGK